MNGEEQSRTPPRTRSISSGSTSFERRSASSIIGASVTSPTIAMLAIAGCESTKATPASICSWWSSGSYQVAYRCSPEAGQFRLDTVLMVISPASWRCVSSARASKSAL